MQLALDSGLDVNCVDDSDAHGMTAVHIAALTGDTAVCKLLLDCGADVNRLMAGGWAPIHFASMGGHHAVCQLLLSHGATITAFSHPHDTKFSAHEASLHSVFALYCSRELNPKQFSPSFTPLHCAAVAGKADVCTLLCGAQPNIINALHQDYTALLLATVHNHSDAVAALLSCGADVESTFSVRYTPLHAAASRGHLQIASSLIAYGAAVNAVTEDLWTPLHHAAWGLHVDLCELLLTEGGNQLALGPDRFLVFEAAYNCNRSYADHRRESVCQLLVAHLAPTPPDVLLPGDVSDYLHCVRDVGWRRRRDALVWYVSINGHTSGW